MNSADDLRTAIISALYHSVAEVDDPSPFDVTESVLDVLRHPLLQLEVLNLVGDVEFLERGEYPGFYVGKRGCWLVTPRGEATGA